MDGQHGRVCWSAYGELCVKRACYCIVRPLSRGFCTPRLFSSAGVIAVCAILGTLHS